MRKFHNEPSVKKELLLNDEALKEFLKNGGKLECSMCGQGFVEGEAYTNHLKVGSLFWNNGGGGGQTVVALLIYTLQIQDKQRIDKIL